MSSSITSSNVSTPTAPVSIPGLIRIRTSSIPTKFVGSPGRWIGILENPALKISSTTSSSKIRSDGSVYTLSIGVMIVQTFFSFKSRTALMMVTSSWLSLSTPMVLWRVTRVLSPLLRYAVP
ncbi:hypothetical protein OGAPHI_003218 [Ogataea philodendri]|uniref:Uncharacterized protein n=1 Tax=Ogataea philodendri TaxID=1378263 RepID=A0A9P8T5W4_9ASCO|nr:uncharacterized protein OGAPHI_003218 [Ogataea philodendri]KAH3666769.1 hypothetical protein OGAPHI_003218 [Ogataea philodendri]